jgi:UDP-glucuronate 4-epimerase
VIKDKSLIAITGGCGFIGANLANYLANQGYRVIVIDSMAPVYNSALVLLRKKMLQSNARIKIIESNLNKISHSDLKNILSGCSNIFHLAAFPGVQQSSIHPEIYLQNNVNSFSKILSVSMDLRVDRLFFASSSSVYGENSSMEAVRESKADGSNLKSFYAQTKWSNELMAKDFVLKSDFPIIGLRFFTVFGPWGRPDMSYWRFAQNLELRKSISLFGIEGGIRNFTYIRDVEKILEKLLNVDYSPSFHPINIASGIPVTAKNLALMIAKEMKVDNPIFENFEKKSFDVSFTWADLSILESFIGSVPQPDLLLGVRSFVNWYSIQDPNIRLRLEG